MHEILFSTTVLAAFLGGAVALFAPCCISVMLPAYFATSFERRRALVSMTFVFALGVAAIILPIAFGASWVSRLIVGQHLIVFLVGGGLMVALGLATLAGWKPSLPMPGMQARGERGPGAVFALGAFSGVASACCAPVLAGVVALSGAVGSFVSATAVGVAYVFGMVVPLFVIALLWDRYDWGNSALLRGRTLTLSAFGRMRRIHSTSLISGLLLLAMGVLVVALGFTGTAMPRRGWQVELSARLQHYAKVVLSWFDWLPGWASATLILVALGALVWKAVVQAAGAGGEDDEDIRAEDGEAPAALPLDRTPAPAGAPNAAVRDPSQGDQP